MSRGEITTTGGVVSGPTGVSVASGWSIPPKSAEDAPAVSVASLEPGSILGGRYEILQLLGEGGMGAVFKARDTELDRLVAIKVIKPELAGRSEILQRFKQELILARKITHKNVIRIFDLGQADGIKFITMEYVEGLDLKHFLKQRGRKLEPKEAAEIMRQVARALEAAHSESVIHRDLKPGNVMIESGQGRVLVMDFGIARSMESTGMTQTGMMVGTPEYMSPEQAKGERLDQRSDLFTFGIIFYELLTGHSPYESETAIGTLMKRLQQRAVPPIERDQTLPRELSDVVVRCLAIARDERYQNATELLQDLEAWLEPEAAHTKAPVRVVKAARYYKWAAGGLAVLLLAVGGFLFREWRLRNTPATQRPAVTVLVADFNNTTGDPVFNGTLEPTFVTALEGASFITAYDRGAARRMAAKLRPEATRLDEALAKLVALREGVDYVVTGSIAQEGGGYRLLVGAIRGATGRSVTTREVSVANKGGVLGATGRLAARVRTALGDDTPEPLQLAAADTFTAASLEAAHAYGAAKDFEVAGKKEEAIASFLRAVELDPNMGRAYTGLAVAYVNLRKRAEAGEHFKKSLTLLDRMSEREKYRSLGIYYLSFMRNYQQAIDTYTKLVSLYPGDGAGYNNLAIAYAYVGNIPEALAAARRALEISPNNLGRRLSVAIYQMFSANFDACIAETERILKENPGYDFAYLPLALSHLARGEEERAREVYGRLAGLGPHGDSLAKIGEADLELYLGRYKAALQALEAGIAADQKEKNTGEMAVKYVAKAEAHLALGQRAPAVAAATRAVELNPIEGVLFPAGRVLAQAGAEEKAREVAATLEKMLQSQTRAYARLISGELALERNRLPEAVESFREAQKLHDSWPSHFLLGKAYTLAGHHAEALTELEICRKRRGETTEVFFADITTLRYLPPLYYWLGRAQEGIGTVEAARASFREFLKLRAKTDPGDALVADAGRRGGG